MRILISEIRAALKLHLYMPSLISLFAIPDMAGTIEYGSGKNADRYERWFDEYVGQAAAGMSGRIAWLARNALIHESAINWGAKGFDFDRLLIGLPRQGIVMHGFTTQMADNNPALVVDLSRLSNAILDNAERWLAEAENDPAKRDRINGLMQYRPDGFPPQIIGMSIIT